MSPLTGAARSRLRKQAGFPLTDQEIRRRQRQHAARVQLDKVARSALAEELANWKVEHGCVDCGFSAHHEALDFDHLPACGKTANVSRLLNSRGLHRQAKIRAIWDEVQRCEVVCANCHRIRTARRRHDLISVPKLKHSLRLIDPEQLSLAL